MLPEKLPASQRSAWLFAAMVPPLSQLAGGGSWLWLLAAGFACLILNRARRNWSIDGQPAWLRMLTAMAAVLVLGEFGYLSAGSWPTGNSFPAVSLILLALSAWSASKGVRAAAQVGAVLFWFIVIVYLLVFASGMKQVRWEWLRPVGTFDPLCLTVLLLPSAAEYLHTQGSGDGKKLLALSFAVGAILLTQGILSPGAAMETEHPFYEMCRSLELLGIAQRFESVICAAATVGWFSAMTLLLSVISALFGEAWGKSSVWLAASAAGVYLLSGLHISGWILAADCAIFWTAVPYFAQGIEKIKKS